MAETTAGADVASKIAADVAAHTEQSLSELARRAEVAIKEGLAELKELVPGATTRVVVNRLRASAIPGDAEAEVRAALSRYAGVEQLDVVPLDVEALDAALAQGRTLAEVAPGSPARQAIAMIAASLVGAPSPARRRRLLRR